MRIAIVILSKRVALVVAVLIAGAARPAFSDELSIPSAPFPNADLAHAKDITHPVWLHVNIKPAYYPYKAQRLEREGDVVVRCFLNAKLQPGNCIVIKEDPVGFGFGEATINLFIQQQASSASSPGDIVEYPMRWRLRG